MAETTISVIICAHTMERHFDLRAAVQSVHAQDRPADEIVVVIDHNEELLTAVADLEARVIPNTGPKGLSGARNTGTWAATSDVVAYLDDDATAAPDWLAHLAAPFVDPAVVAVGGWANPNWDTEPPGWFPDEFAWVIGCSHRGLPTELTEVRNVIGCNMAFRRSAVIDAEGFTTTLGRTADRPLGCEETELCIRIRQSDPGARILLEPRATVSHRVPAGRARWQYFAQRCRAEGNSKAHVAKMVGSDDALSSERDYVRRVLPRAFVSAARSVPSEPVDSVLRMAALGGGLAITAGGYVEYAMLRRS
ncbi:MAG: glycosyltransferase family 2 protein [Actinomycetota bacterium]